MRSMQFLVVIEGELLDADNIIAALEDAARQACPGASFTCADVLGDEEV